MGIIEECSSVRRDARESCGIDVDLSAMLMGVLAGGEGDMAECACGAPWLRLCVSRSPAIFGEVRRN